MIGTTDQIVETLARPPGALRLLLHRGPRGGDGGVRPGGGRPRRYLGVGDRRRPHRDLRWHLRSHPHRPSRGGRGGAGAPGPGPDAADGGQPALAEGRGPAAHPGRGPLRHGRGGRAGWPGLEPSRMEIDRGGPTYTIDTVRQLLDEEPGAEVTLVVGSDVVGGLTTWKDEAALRERSPWPWWAGRGSTRWPRRPGGAPSRCRWPRSTCPAPSSGAGSRPDCRWRAGSPSR